MTEPLILPTLKAADEIAALPEKARAAGVELVGPWGSGKALAAWQTAQQLGLSLIYVTAGRIESEQAYEDLSTFAGADACALLPAWEVLPSDAMEPAADIVADRMSALKQFARALERKEPVCGVMSVRALMQRVVKRADLLRDTLTLRVGDEHDLEELVAKLVKQGYEREMMVEQRGQLSVRGGLFDIFPVSGELPYRIEFFGDEIESIRRFEPETQRSVDRLDELQILPRSERKLLRPGARKADELTDIFDYFSDDALVAVDEPLAVAEEAERLERQFGDTPYMLKWERIGKLTEKRPKLDLAQVALRARAGITRFTAPMQSMAGWRDRADGFWDQLQEWEHADYTVLICCNNTGERRRLLELLEERGYRPGKGNFDLRLALGQLRAGFASSHDKLAVLSEREIFGRKYVRRKRRRFEAGAAITAFSDLKAGDYVVHLDHGIGRYLGLRRFPGKAGDFLGIQLSGGDIYVPVTHVDHVQKYVGGDGAVPKMDKLGGASWARTKDKVKKAVEEMARELIELYAARATQPGHAFNKDAPWQFAFEDSFEYEETADQLRAITEIKADMETPKPMDRLLCGDVGYGKTEVALRAAFKAVTEGFQVAVLVPTTVLAEQHYNTFRERLADFPVKVEMLSRFRTGKEQGEIVKALRAGEIDIVVGTHRLTSGDVQFKNLGLVILDEEQRFGVKHKERLKQLKTNVDVLTLSATPIPRTLHMALLGARDMSIINTAPNDRLPIHTCIDVFDEDLVREAINRELAREGQVFYLHNRVQSIEKVAEMVQRLVPHARVAIGHGQMNEHALEEVMTKFIRHDVDVLVCTTIIGSGLDIPNANTIIVDRADQFGLSELYQLRGRVGRYKHRAFAYLLVPGDRALSEDAQKRLKALEEFSTLGSGFRIAMRDLEIRGAGNMLGHKQSGHIAAVGYDAYTQILEEAVAEAKGEPIRHYALPPFDAPADGYIPDDYVESESQKITLYKRISSLHSRDEVDDMAGELEDRFGPVPKPVKRLLDVMRVRVAAGEAGAAKVAANKEKIAVDFRQGVDLDAAAQRRLREQFGRRVEFGLNKTATLIYRLEENEDPVERARTLFASLHEDAAVA